MRKKLPAAEPGFWQTERGEKLTQFFLMLIYLSTCICSFWLLADYAPLLHLNAAPDFWAENILKANFVCFGPALLGVVWVWTKQMYFPHKSYRYEKIVLGILVSTTLAMLVVANTSLFYLHFTTFSPDRYVRCWEPFPVSSTYFAKSPEICVQHGLAPVHFLSR
ncbi:hypothetical protein GJV06_08730 [Enterobacteriaceae bacterium RIT691]|nr:hypothetical protein [Enterobacteriaceae bacterium RIT691]